jgi:hypothetical protein
MQRDTDFLGLAQQSVRQVEWIGCQATATRLQVRSVTGQAIEQLVQPTITTVSGRRTDLYDIDRFEFLAAHLSLRPQEYAMDLPTLLHACQDLTNVEFTTWRGLPGVGRTAISVPSTSGCDGLSDQ